jgi:hypothetical protein
MAIGNAGNLRVAFDIAGDFGTVRMFAANPLLRNSCGVHTADLVLVDLLRVMPFAEALERLGLFMPLIRAPAHRIGLKAAGIDGEIPLVQDRKWSTEVRSFLFYRRKAVVFERVIFKQKWQAPQSRDHYNLVIDALVPTPTLIERTERDETALSESFRGTVNLQG